MNKYIKAIFIIVAVLAVAEFFIWLFGVPAYIFPRPSDVLQATYTNANLLFSNFLITLAEASLGFIIANLISVALAFTIYFYPRIENYVISSGVVLKTIPIIALTPLLIIWLGPGITSKIATAALICFFPALVSMTRGMKSLETDYKDLFKLYSASKRKQIKLLLLPGSVPFLISSLKISSSLAVVGALVGEFIGANKGLGFVIIVNYYNFDVPLVFAAIALSSLMGLGFYYLLDLLESKIYRRETVSSDF